MIRSGKVKLIDFAAMCLLLTVAMHVNAAGKDTLVVGRVHLSGAAVNDMDIKARAEAVVRQMSDLGVTKVEILELNSISKMIDAFNSGEVDWVTESLFPGLIYAEYAGADIFEYQLKAGLPKFYSVFFVKKDSEIDSIDKIERKILAFGNAFSTGSYFAPYYELNERRYTLVNYGVTLDEEVIGKRRIYFKFSANESEIANNVLTGKANVGVMAHSDFVALPKDQREQFKVIHNTAAFIRQVEVVRGGLELEIKKRLKQLIAEHNAENETPVLRIDNEKTTRFYRFVGEGRDGFVYLRSLVEHGTVPVLIEKKQKKKKKDYFY